LLIDDIIQLLSSDQGSITEALLKTKILLHQIGHRELTEWVNDELNGYSEEKIVPLYRITRPNVVGTLVNIRVRAPQHPIPIGHLSEKEREMLEIIPVRQSLAVVAQLSDSKHHLQMPLPMEDNHRLGAGLEDGTFVEKAWLEISPVYIKNIVFQVRSRLLDFMLDLKSSIGSATSEDDVTVRSENVDAPSLFNKAIFGPNATIIVGSHNKQAVETTVVQGDFNSLVANLKALGVGDGAIADLRQAVEHQGPKEPTTSLKGRIGSWFKAQAEKQLDAGAQVAVSASMDAIVHAIKLYLGS
jgi:hypothetical protein